MAWWYGVWPLGNNMVYSMAWRVLHGIWYGTDVHNMIYGMALRAWHRAWYGIMV